MSQSEHFLLNPCSVFTQFLLRLCSVVSAPLTADLCYVGGSDFDHLANSLRQLNLLLIDCTRIQSCFQHWCHGGCITTDYSNDTGYYLALVA